MQRAAWPRYKPWLFSRASDSGCSLPTLHTKFGALPNTIAALPEAQSLSKLSAWDIGGVVLAGLTVAFVSDGARNADMC